MTNRTKGYILAASSAAMYGMNPLFALPLYEDGMSVDSVLFFRYLFALPLVALYLRSQGRNFSLQKREIFPSTRFALFCRFAPDFFHKM